MDFGVVDILALFMLHFIHSACTDNIRSCNVTRLNNCPKNQKCLETSHKCVCLPGFIKYEDECVAPGSDISANRDTTAVVVSIFTIALIAVGLGLVIRKYNLIEYVRQKINLRRNNDVMYEDVMIGQDDPPLVP